MSNKRFLYAYILNKEKTIKQTGYFAVIPAEDLPLDEALADLMHRPQDDFLHQYALTLINRMPPDTLRQFIDRSVADNNPVHQSLAAEYLFLAKGREHLEKRFATDVIRELIHHTPLIYLRSFMEPDQALHSQWTSLFRANLQRHAPLPPPQETGLPPLMLETASRQPAVTIAELTGSSAQAETSAPVAIPPGEIADMASDRLEQAGVELGKLMRHESSLSPIGLLRTWRFATRVNNQRNRFSFSGEQTSYGRGLTLDVARASLMMEIVERYSAFVSVSEHGLENYQNNYPLRYAPYSELTKKNTDGALVINPADLALEVSYQDQSLHWVCGETPNPDKYDKGNNSRPVWMPVQCLFLFCNLDEPALFSSLGSTGLASGSTIAQAKVAALLEIVERHQVATTPYDLSTCFQLIARDPHLAALLEAYRQADINLWFQDITPPNGIPCCRCFVVEKTGELHVGAAAHLDARRAILSAITETTCPFPNAPPTLPAPFNLMPVGYENLPNFSTNDAAADLAILETLFIQNNCRPCYLDLTRSDIGLPVVKAVVPGREILGDFDTYSRVHPDLYQNYLSSFKSGKKGENK